MPTPALLNLLDGPVDVDPAFHIIWSRFRMMRRYLAYCPEEEPRIFRMLDLISRGAQGRGPVHLLLTSASELGFVWDSDEKGWVRVSLPPLRMMTGPVQHFRSAILDAWRFSVFASRTTFSCLPATSDRGAGRPPPGSSSRLKSSGWGVGGFRIFAV